MLWYVVMYYTDIVLTIGRQGTFIIILSEVKMLSEYLIDEVKLT